jgi:hypothetical protein
MPLLPRFTHPLDVMARQEEFGVLRGARRGTSPPRATDSGGEKSSRLVG